MVGCFEPRCASRDAGQALCVARRHKVMAKIEDHLWGEQGAATILGRHKHARLLFPWAARLEPSEPTRSRLGAASELDGFC